MIRKIFSGLASQYRSRREALPARAGEGRRSSVVTFRRRERGLNRQGASQSRLKHASNMSGQRHPGFYRVVIDEDATA